MTAAIVLLLIAAAPVSHAQTAGRRPFIEHSPPEAAVAGRTVEIVARLVGEGPSRSVVVVDIMVMVEGGSFVPIPMTILRGELKGEIPASVVSVPSLMYYLRAIGAEAEVITAPPSAPERNPFAVRVGERPMTEEIVIGQPAEENFITGLGGIEVLAPLPGEVVPYRRPEVVAAIDPPLDEPWDAFMLVDGRDVTGATIVDAHHLHYVPDDSLAVGPHEVTFAALTPSRHIETTWTFFVLETAPPPADPMTWLTSGEAAWMKPQYPPDDGLSGSVRLGWAYVEADADFGDTLDAYLAYDEVSLPTLDIYALGDHGTGLFSLSVSYDPVYDDRALWTFARDSERLEFEVGDIYPDLSPTTLDWASGVGASIRGTLGAGETELLGMRISEADTLGGVGIFSRYAVGGSQSLRFSEHVDASLIYLYAFDRDQSVSEEERLNDPLRNHVVAGLVTLESGPRRVEIEVAHSDATGEVEGAGEAYRVRLELVRDISNRIALEYVDSAQSFFSAGSIETDPGERGAELELAYGPAELMRVFGSFGVLQTRGGRYGLDEDKLSVEAYGRADMSFVTGPDYLRTYAIARYMRKPYETYDYAYSYGTLGGSWRRGRARGSVSGSYSRTRSPGKKETYGAGGDLRIDIVPPSLWTRLGVRWTEGNSTDGSTDYTRMSYELAATWRLLDVDLTCEYRILDWDDRFSPDESYLEHIVEITVGWAF